MTDGQTYATLIIIGVLFSLPVLYGIWCSERPPRKEEMTFDPRSSWEEDQRRRTPFYDSVRELVDEDAKRQARQRPPRYQEPRRWLSMRG